MEASQTGGTTAAQILADIYSPPTPHMRASLRPPGVHRRQMRIKMQMRVHRNLLRNAMINVSSGTPLAQLTTRRRAVSQKFEAVALQRALTTPGGARPEARGVLHAPSRCPNSAHGKDGAAGGRSRSPPAEALRSTASSRLACG